MSGATARSLAGWYGSAADVAKDLAVNSDRLYRPTSEYQVASGMIWEGMLTEGLSIAYGVHTRYDGKKHNPWNEIEGGKVTCVIQTQCPRCEDQKRCYSSGYDSPA